MGSTQNGEVRYEDEGKLAGCGLRIAGCGEAESRSRNDFPDVEDETRRDDSRFFLFGNEVKTHTLFAHPSVHVRVLP